MRTKSHCLFIAAMCLAVSALAAPSGLVNKSGTGTTSATVYFEPGTRQAPLTYVDVTSDKAASVLSWKVGTDRAELLFNAANNVTNITLTSSTAASNDVLLSLTSAGSFRQHTVWGVTQITNRTVLLHNPPGTNIAVGDAVREITGTYKTLAKPVTATSNLYFLDQVNGIAEDDVLLAEISPWLLETNVVASTATNTVYALALRGGRVLTDLEYGAAVYERLGGTNYATLLADVAADGTALHVDRTNEFTAEKVVLIQSANGGLRGFATIAEDGVTETNLTVAEIGFNASAGDTVWVLSDAFSIAYPAGTGDRALVLNSDTDIAAGDELVVNSVPIWSDRVLGKSTNSNYTLTFDEGAVHAMPIGTRFYTLTTNLYAVTKASAAASPQITLDGGTGLASGDYVLISPATGGHVRRQVSTTAADIYEQISLTAVTGAALSAGDQVYVLGSAVTTPVGAATVRLQADALRILPQNMPGVLSVDGTSACTINAAIVDYGQ
jgi:hypothetical protein